MSNQPRSRLADLFPELGDRRISSLRRQELANCCARLGLDSSGNRPTLLSRLSRAIQSGTHTAPGSTAPQTRSSNNTSVTTSSAPQTLTAPPGTLLPPVLSGIGGVGNQIPVSSLPPAGNSSLNSSWLHTVAQQAAQSALTQALALQPATAQQGPILPTLHHQAPTPMVQLTQATVTPIQSSAIHPAHNTVLSSQAARAHLPASSSSAPEIPTPQILPTGATASIAGFNLPGELSGMLSHTVINKILTLQYFDLSALMPANMALARDPQPIRVQLGADETHQLVLSRRPASRKTITTIQEWCIAFSMYATVLSTADPSRGPDLFEYLRLILEAEKEYKGDAWLRYDVAFRTRAANRHMVRWAEPDSTLWNRAFSGMCKTSSYCSICLDPSHTTTECPLYQQGPATRRSTTPAGPSQQSGNDLCPTIRQICFNWNRGKCRFANCRRAHVSTTHGCGGKHRFTECPNRRVSPRKALN